MNKPTPVEISPNPLVTSTIEIRFKSTFDSTAILAVIYPLVIEDFNSVISSQIPSELKIKEEFKYAPDFIFSNPDYSFSFNDCVIVFDNVGEYKFWDNYFPFVKKQLTKVLNLNFIESIERVGIRYASIFEKETSLEGVALILPKFKIDGFEDRFKIFRTDLKQHDFNFHLQLANQAKITRRTTDKIFSGAYIDIDASCRRPIQPADVDSVFDLIDSLHKEEKELFFNKLLNPQFVEKLNPKY